MSGEEAAIGLPPAGVVAFMGLVLVRSGRSVRHAAAGASAQPGPHVSTEGLDGTVIDMLPGSK
jgi:hypothetical protein